MAERDKDDLDRAARGPHAEAERNQEGNQQSGLGGGSEPGQPEVEGDAGAEQDSGGHGDKSDRRGGPTL